MTTPWETPGFGLSLQCGEAAGEVARRAAMAEASGLDTL